MKILVTGGAGYIGSTLVPMLLEKGYQVRVLDNLTFGAQTLLPCFSSPDFELQVGDIRDEEAVRKSLEGVDAIIHLAALVGFPSCRKDPWEAWSINYEGTVTLDKLRGDRLLIYSSTGSNYGKVDGLCTEESPLRPLSIYGQTKTAAEQYLLSKGDVIVYRFATAFGLAPRLRNDLLINNFVLQAVKNKCLLVYEKDNKRTFIHVKDIARSFVFALENQDQMKNQVYNVGSEAGNMTKEEVVLLLREKFEFIYQFAEGWKDEDMRDYVVDYTKINKLGYKTTINISDGVEEMIKAFKVI